MEYLSSLVASYSITVPFALKKLGERNLSDQDIEEMRNFIFFHDFRRNYEDVTERWESLESSPQLRFLIIYLNNSKFDGHRIFINDGHRIFINGLPSFKQYMQGNRNEIHKVYMHNRGETILDANIYKIRNLTMPIKS